MEKLAKDDFTGKFEGIDPNPNIPLRYLTAKSIIADKVYDTNAEAVGKIEDIMLDITTGKIDYIIVECGGFLGINVKYFAIPFNMLQVDEEKQAFIYKGNKEQLENAPGFDLDHWPHTNFHAEESYWHFMP